jgi:hypothetical protein
MQGSKVLEILTGGSGGQLLRSRKTALIGQQPRLRSRASQFVSEPVTIAQSEGLRYYNWPTA